MSHFQTIGIIGKRAGADQILATLERLVAFLHASGRRVYFDEASGGMLGAPPEAVLPLADLGSACDLAVVVGGDGTLLQAARALNPQAVPLVGINLGRLGFLVDISPHEIETCLTAILDGQHDAESRTMLGARVVEDGVPGDTLAALNDVVIHRWDTARMIELQAYIDGTFVYAQRSDGIIVATPTGSTAYALSGGGPLLHPGLDALVLVPICPHTLSNRPLVVGGASRIELMICGVEHGQAQLTCDGQTSVALRGRSRILIEKLPNPTRLLHPKGHDHYKILRAKLGWGGHMSSNNRC